MIDEINRKIECMLAESRRRRKQKIAATIVSTVLCVSSAVYLGVRYSSSLHQPESVEISEKDAGNSDVQEASVAPVKSEPVYDDYEIGLDNLIPASVREETVIDITVMKGDTLVSSLTRNGVDFAQAKNIAAAVKSQTGFTAVSKGQELQLTGVRDMTGEIDARAVEINLSPSKRIAVERKNAAFKAEAIDVPLKRELSYASGIIKESLFETAIKMGVPQNRMSDLVNLFRYDVDFEREIAAGDTFEVIIEKFYNDEDKFSHYGKILFTALNLKNEKHAYYYYTTADGGGDFYNEKGESIRKALLKTPVSAARITSGFGLRSHPVLGYTRMHKGVDFAASTGTPILAAGDGVVEMAGRLGGYGNYLKIKHTDKYSTAYGHTSRFADGIKVGSKVKQGQVVAYVGSTGVSTGPHLHFEVLVGGEQVNPLGVKFASGKKLGGRELAQFRSMTGNIRTYLASLPKPGEPTRLASNSR